MQPKLKKHYGYAKWQNFLIIFVLLLMLVSALPNFYSTKSAIELRPKSSQSHPVAIPTLNQWFVKADIVIDKIQRHDGMTRILLTKQADQQAVQNLLQTKVAHDYLITQVIENSAPTWLQTLPVSPIKLGLDLSGGVLFVLDVDTEQAMLERFNTIALTVQEFAMAEKIPAMRVESLTDKGIRVHFPKVSPVVKQTLLKKLTNSYPNLTQQKLTATGVNLVFSDQQQQRFRTDIMQQILTTMRGRIAELGITEAVVQKQGRTGIRIELPGVHDSKEAERIIGATAALNFYQLAEPGKTAGITRIRDEDGRLLQLNSKVIFSGEHIENAQAGHDQLGQPLVNLALDSVGGEKMSAFSKAHIGQPIVTVFSEYYTNAEKKLVKRNKVISLAIVQQHLGSQFSITHMPSLADAQQLALLLRAGSLTAPVSIVQQRTIEATLGADNIERGIAALALGITITLLFMLCWYRRLGVIANIALTANLVSLLGLMSLLPGVVLTLPGIAGLVLTVGMAVDTNVLIFERIKDELARGRPSLVAIEQGYNKAFSSILDANVTTMLTGLILYSIGYGAIKGFAIILCLGIFTSIFTGVCVAKALTYFMVRRSNRQLVLGVQS